MNNKKFNQVLSNGRTKLKEILQEMIDEKLFSEQSTKIPEVFELQNNYPNISSAEFLKIVNDYADFYYMWYKDKCTISGSVAILNVTDYKHNIEYKFTDKSLFDNVSKVVFRY